ncbi:MAG: NAD-dependent epimerase/dehydratase family protein [Phycicoccus sp.]|nr:NAD-dependent epimerase/dehydratase family protein [Phycicoccus sp.]
MTTPRATLVIGSRGLLGRSVSAAIDRRTPGRLLVQTVCWAEDDVAGGDLVGGLDRLLAVVDGGPWSIVWCAGVGVTSTRPTDLKREVDVLRRFLTTVADRAKRADTGPGMIFYASSAGAVYAGSQDPPFTEASVPRPLAPYGEAKLAAEQALREICVPAGVSILVGRISNVYGPGQDVRKPQGLITQLCRAHVNGQPTSVYVSLDTLRDYLYVADCADMVLDGIERLACEQAARTGAADGLMVTKIFASQRSVSIGSLLMESRRVFRRAPRVLVASSPFAKVQARDLRLRSVVWPELDRRVLTSIPAGIGATVAEIQMRMLEPRSS